MFFSISDTLKCVSRKYIMTIISIVLNLFIEWHEKALAINVKYVKNDEKIHRWKMLLHINCIFLIRICRQIQCFLLMLPSLFCSGAHSCLFVVKLYMLLTVNESVFVSCILMARALYFLDLYLVVVFLLRILPIVYSLKSFQLRLRSNLIDFIDEIIWKVHQNRSLSTSFKSCGTLFYGLKMKCSRHVFAQQIRQCFFSSFVFSLVDSNSWSSILR